MEAPALVALALLMWPATLTGAGKPQLSSTGFELPSKGSFSLDAPPGWSGRFWGRTHCFIDPSGKFTCATADCASGQISCNGAGGVSPASLVELTLASNASGQDYYDTSLVDGFNLPLSLAPAGAAGSGCKATSCPSNVNAACPADLAVKSGDGSVIGCKSACVAFNTPEYCCQGEFGGPQTCHPTNYSRIFKKLCPQSYSYAYDDKTSTFTCSGSPNYVITFCP
ncbi:hypothetical protein Fmac_030814 [Flemingia macrophylla]|uniref:Thaumatin-like protein n=1 Tax=Flemingia macrophylla TaxID=520843 RepID=A0ABD1L0P4_9FABA